MIIIEQLKKLGFSTVDKNYYEHIQKWYSWYKGKVDSFHNYSVYNGTETVELEKASLNMAKTLCEDWANYIFNKDTKISTGIEASDEALTGIMEQVRWSRNMSEVIESAFAGGTAGVTIIEDAGKVDLFYIKDATMIFPLKWDNGEVVDCCFAGYKYIAGVKHLYLNIHLKVADGWEIYNKFYTLDNNGNIKEEVQIDGVATVYKSALKRYFLFSPCVLNNIDVSCPLGVSIYANAIDALKGIDTVYDSYINEFVLGKKRIMVSSDMVQVAQKNDKMRPLFDKNETVFYAMPSTSVDGSGQIKEIDMSLRVQEHKEGIQDMLNMLSVKAGMGTKHYSFVGGAVTATEVKSTADTLYNSMLKHETALEPFLKGVLDTLLALHGINATVSVEFDDSVIRDTNQDLLNMMQLLNARVIGRAQVLAWWKGCDLESAREQIKVTDAEENAGGFNYNVDATL